MSHKILERSDDLLVRDVDSGINDAWRWEWMETSIVVNVNEKLQGKTSWTGGPLKICAKDHIRKLIYFSFVARMLGVGSFWKIQVRFELLQFRWGLSL